MIEGIDLSCRFGGFFALKGVSLSVPKGEIRGLIGPNGAGKSTLIDVLSGRRASSSGRVLLDGKDISAMSVQQRRHAGLARSFQRTNIFAALTIRDQLEIAAHHAALDVVDEVMRELDLADFAERTAAEASYGIQRRVDLALALVGRPTVLLLDEPAAGLSTKESMVLAQLLRKLAGRWQVTVLLVEHDMEVVFSVCDRITVLQLGGVLAEGTPAEIRVMPDVIRAYLGSAA